MFTDPGVTEERGKQHLLRLRCTVAAMGASSLLICLLSTYGELHNEHVADEIHRQASPKFGTFICLSCAGTHRGLGVHISFVRSVSMDAFKVGEIARMDKGGNKSWRRFFEEHESTKGSGLDWNETTIPDRYGSDVGDEWKQRLTATVEGREYVPEEKPKAEATRSPDPPLAGDGPVNTSDSARKASNEAYFARLSAQNAARPAGTPPSQGGKYAGFGSDSTEQNTNNPPVMPTAEDFQKDPVAALTKGFGWFSTTVGKGAKTVNDGWIQPAAQKVWIALSYDYFQHLLLSPPPPF